MLILIGLGLETKDISIRGLQTATEAKRVYIEQYTAFVSDEYIKYLKDSIGQEISQLDRSDLEENAKKTISEAKKNDIAILVPGDPLIATTHFATLINTARKLGVKYKILHSSSIYSAAVGESGLDIYKFGPPVTIAYWSDKYKPTSFLDLINQNCRHDHHTLVLLDLNQKEKRPMRLEEAVSLLRQAENEKLLDIITDDLKILVMGNVGKENQQTAYVSIKDTAKVAKEFDGKMLVIIVPATLNFAEEESISRHLSQA